MRSIVSAAMCISLFFGAGFVLWAQDGEPRVSEEEPRPVEEPLEDPPEYAVDPDTVSLPDSPVFDPEEMSDMWEFIDSNDDGHHDYAVIVDEQNRLLRAAMDYSGDGLFDNFYFYDGGELYQHDIDTNNDGRVDLRVYVRNGTSVSGFEQDTNHDGTMDRVEEYGTE